MAQDVIMPALGMAQETGTLLQWLKTEGEEIAKGEPLMEVETDKAAVEVESPASGTLANVTAQPGDEVPVGQVIALILAPGEQVPQSASKSADIQPVQAEISATDSVQSHPLASPVATRIAAEHNVDLNNVTSAGGRIQKEDVLAYLARHADEPNGRIPASPKARRLASERDLDLAAITGSGPNGAVLAADVESYAPPIAQTEPDIATQSLTPAGELQTLTMSRMWRIAANRLTESWQTVPHFYLIKEVNAGQLITWRNKANRHAKTKITYTDLLVKAVTTALRRHSRLNAMWRNGEITLNPQVNIGLAIAVEDGLIVPVIHQADTLSVNDIAARRLELVDRAKTGKLTPEDLQGGTFTISNLGMYGVDAFNAIVNPPQAAILAISQIADRVVPVNGQPAVQPMMNLSLSCDHRVVDGARGAQFLQALANYIEEPLTLL